MENTLLKNKFFSKGTLETYSLILVVFVLVVILSMVTQTFLTRSNLLNVLRQISINGILAIGMTFVVLTGGIDLSVGSVVAFCGIVSAGMIRDAGLPVGVVIAISLLVGIVLGLFNGYFVAFWNAAPFVVTLSLMTIARGMTFVYCQGKPISPLTAEFLNIGRGDIFGLPIPAFILFLVFITGFVVLRYFSIGRYIYAVGGNENSAMVSGINVRLVKLSAYAISGCLCGLVAIILTSRVSAGMPQAGQSYELDAIAATVIGGTSLSGGRGRLWGTILGALLLGIVSNGLDLLNVSSFYQQIVKGIIILGAILIDSKR
jgi:ribose/xylose/arabinose/galactoside ABC-type transport system permease subunit